MSEVTNERRRRSSVKGRVAEKRNKREEDGEEGKKDTKESIFDKGKEKKVKGNWNVLK